MKVNARPARAALAVGSVLASSCHVASAQTQPDYRRPPGREWPIVGRDFGNTRYSTTAFLIRECSGSSSCSNATRRNGV